MTRPGRTSHGTATSAALAAWFLAVAMVGGSLPIVAAPSAIAAPAAFPAARVQLAANGDLAPDRDTYTQQAQADIEAWRQKLRDFGATADAKGDETRNAADADLTRAWNNAEAAGHRLAISGDAEWASAKSSFEQASRELTAAWDKRRPSDK
jgi:hypothetical protein